MTDHNPYAPPKTFKATSRLESKGVWRDGKDLVIAKGEHFPARCVKCNQPGQPRKRATKVYWHTPWLYLLIFISPPIYVIVALIARKKAEIAPALCEQHHGKRKRAILIGWLGTFILIAMALVSGSQEQGSLVAMAFLLLVLLIVVTMIRTRVLVTRKIDDNNIRLRGCGDEFLDSLPEF